MVAVVSDAYGRHVVNQGLETFRLHGGVRLRKLGYLPVIVGLGSNETLQVLNCNDVTDFDDECALLLARLLRRPNSRSKLHEIDLMETRVGHDGALALVACPTVERIQLSFTKITGDTVCSMIEQMDMLPNLELDTRVLAGGRWSHNWSQCHSREWRRGCLVGGKHAGDGWQGTSRWHCSRMLLACPQ